MWGRVRRPGNDDFPDGFRIQRIGVDAAKAVAKLSPEEIASYFREHPEVAKDLLRESYDKRYSPSSFISEENSGFLVGWFSTPFGCECQRQFSNLPDAATDYLLFSLGKGRWTASEATDPIVKTQKSLAPIREMQTAGTSDRFNSPPTFGFLANYARMSDDIGRVPFWKPLATYVGMILFLPLGLLILIFTKPILYLTGIRLKTSRGKR
jgi:hypothetical protein